MREQLLCWCASGETEAHTLSGDPGVVSLLSVALRFPGVGVCVCVYVHKRAESWHPAVPFPDQGLGVTIG